MHATMHAYVFSPYYTGKSKKLLSSHNFVIGKKFWNFKARNYDIHNLNSILCWYWGLIYDVILIPI